MRRFRLYVQETVDELLYKVSWPTLEELQSSAIVVIIASLIIAGIVYVMDLGANEALKTVYKLFY